MKVLFVCTGNTCRSVLAHYLLERAAARRGFGWQVRSCGIAADPFFPIPDAVRRILAVRGIDVHHQPRVLSPELVKWADVVLAMTAQHLASLRERFPESGSKTHLLRAYAGLDDADIEDPIGMPEDAYREAAETIGAALERILDRYAAPARTAPARAAKRPARHGRRGRGKR